MLPLAQLRHNRLALRVIPILALVAVHTLFLLPLFRPGFYQSHDGEAHVARFGAYVKAFTDGHIPPRWAGDLNFGFGNPVFIFFYPLPGYIASLLHFSGFSLQGAFKIISGISFVATPALFYLWMSQIIHKRHAFISAIAFGLAPYQFLNLYVRGDIGELLAMSFVPLVLFCIERTIQKGGRLNIFIGGIFYGLLILSHNAISLMFTPIFAIYAVYRNRINRYLLVRCAQIAGIGLSLSCFFWLPALIEARFTRGSYIIGDMYLKHFPTVQQLILSPWGFGTNVREPGGLSPQIGLLHVIGIFFALLFSILQKNRAVMFWLWIFLTGIFFSLSFSAPLWRLLPLIKNFEFPWRFIAIAHFSSSVLIGYIFANKRLASVTFFFTAILLLTSFPLTRVASYVNKPDAFYFSYSGTTFFFDEASPIWTAGNPSKKPGGKVEVIDGEAIVKTEVQKTNKLVLTVNANKTSKLLVNTLYFPGWRSYVNGNKVPIEFQDINHRGLITFNIPKGKSNIVLLFGETPIRFAADTISLLTLGYTVFFLVRNFRKLKHETI